MKGCHSIEPVNNTPSTLALRLMIKWTGFEKHSIMGGVDPRYLDSSREIGLVLLSNALSFNVSSSFELLKKSK